MARVNHKKIKQLIAQKRKTINDRQFFSSRILAGHFSDIAAAQTRRYGYNRSIKVRTVWQPKTPDIASTNNDVIWINAGNSLVTKRKTRPERYDIVCGLFAHELGHVLYTDFLASQTYNNYLEKGNWYPNKPILHTTKERMNESEIWDYIKTDEKNLYTFQMMSHHLLNVLEDGHIESKMLARYPGVLGQSLRVLQETEFEDSPTVSQMIEREDEGGHIWLTITQIMLSYVLWGDIKYGDTPLSDERIQTVFSMLGMLDKAIVGTFKDRCRVANAIIVKCWKEIKDYLEYCEQQSQTANAAGGSTSAGSILSGMLGALAGASTAGTGSTTPVNDPSSAPSLANRRATTHQNALNSGAAPKPPEEDEEPEEAEEAEETAAGGENEDDDNSNPTTAEERIPTLTIIFISKQLQ